MRSVIVKATLAATLMGAGLGVGPASAAGWHDVHERWAPYVESALTLPAARYCGTFDLKSEPVIQDIRVKVLQRWDNGKPRQEKYVGPLIVRVTNLSTGASSHQNLSGHATVLYRADGTMESYEMNGPVGMGFPAGSDGLSQGFYRLTGHHLVTFDADGTRHLALDHGAELNLCNVVG
ncbi:hypothetical protein [Luteipulveratus mongoliensis]|uniref:Uncharacterized protein n=1 Tax=Luteipulveratus mongoliensis TaxID=571913 RepID=A0A0K1JNM0_9MICO|nr:hypothetical protein [Luteipulveratus mongoliensis]AKU18307.1 hypothetical protein VV02_24785 [Luteipulveratus mongoliensis]